MGDVARGPSIAFRRRQTGGSVRLPAALAAPGRRIERWLEAERAQLALWLPVGLLAGVALWFLLPSPRAWTGAIGASAGVALLAAALGRGGRLPRAVALFALTTAIGCGLVWWRAERATASRLARPTVTEFSATVAGVEPLPARDAVRLLLRPVAAPALPRLVRLSVAAEDAPPALARGAVVRLRARLVPPPQAALPGAYDYAETAWFAGIGASGKAIGPVQLVRAAPRSGPASALADARIALSAHIQRALPGPPGGIATALATGDMGAISFDDNNAFRRSGLAHLLSVSGLHLTAVVGATMLIVLRLLALWPRLALRAPLPLIAALAGALAGLAYTLLTGAEVPTVRSLIASLLVLGGIAAGREAMTLRLVAAGALIVTLLWPESAAGPSFQLSFVAILSIVALHEWPLVRGAVAKREESRGRAFARELGGLLLTGIVVEAALAPIAIFHFHRAGFYGALANLIAIPLTTFVIMPAEALALFADLIGLGAPFWWAAGLALRLLLALARWVAALPHASTLVPAMSTGAFAAIIAGGLWLALWRTRARLLGLAPIALGIALTAFAPPPDILISGDGRHVAVRTAAGSVALLRERTGDYMRGMLSELSGIEPEQAGLFDDLPQARCGPDSCFVVLERGGRTWRLLATRSPYALDRQPLEAACAAADIVVSDRRLPRWCRPRWLKADARLLRRTGGLSIRLDPPSIDSVADGEGQHPWAAPALSVRTGRPVRGRPAWRVTP